MYLVNAATIRETVFFPLMRPKESGNTVEEPSASPAAKPKKTKNKK